ncbi:MAG: hypothetical protein R3B72_38910 [Polyangiaceae bacterium]
MTKHAWLFSFLIVAGCGSDTDLVCIDDLVTIGQGIYGELLNGCDTADCETSRASGMEVRVYDEDPTPPDPDDATDDGTTLVPLAVTKADGAGFYEVELLPGSYSVCTNVCTTTTVSPDDAPQRLDWASGPGGGRWYVGSCSP